LYNDLRLLTNPDQVETDDKQSWATAFWYWKANVHSNPLVQAGHFGKSTDLINGALECRGFNTYIAKNRYKKYVNVLKAININEAPIESGCY
jgi:predicted chitinase